MIRLLAALLMFAAPAFAELSKVSSGDHEGFTRLVIEFPDRPKWQLGRTADGYELQITGNPNTYDLSKVFDIIGKKRLAAIWTDPETGNLRIGIACACFAVPFEFRPGIVVIDLKEGTPPAGSSFELTLPRVTNASAVAEQPIKPKPRPKDTANPGPTYDWLRLQTRPEGALPAAKAADTKAKDPQPPLSVPPPSLIALQDSLLFALATGATKGVVDLKLPPDTAEIPREKLQSARLAFGGMPGARQRYADPMIEEKSPLEACPAPDVLNVFDWGNDTSFADQLSLAATGLMGEFDKPDPVALEKYVRLQIFGGFGAEARATLTAFPDSLRDADVLKSLSYLVDSEPENATAFNNMLTCAGPAALWGLLQAPPLQAGTPIDQEAALTAFSALPRHLRRLLGPALADKLTELKLPAGAQAVRDATERGRKPVEGKTDLAAAEWALANGKPADATLMLEGIMKSPGPDAAGALIAWVDAQTTQLLPIDSSVVLALEAFAAEFAGQPQEADLKRAIVFALAGSGEFQRAIAGAKDEDQSRVWALLAEIGTDTAVLENALSDGGETPRMMTNESAERLAERLLELGFPEAARQYVSLSDGSPPLLAAQIELANLDGTAALVALGTTKGDDAAALRARATELTGKTQEARILYEESNLPNDSARISKAVRDWDRVAKDGVEPWAQIALSAATVVADPTVGTLARAAQTVESSATIRAEVQALLEATRVN